MAELEFSLDSLIKYGEVEKEVEPVKGLKIQMRTLSEEDKIKAYALIDSTTDENFLTRMEAFKCPLLSIAIKSINGKIFDNDESKKKLLETLKKTQSYLLDAIYNEYDKLMMEQIDILKSGLKKNN